MSEAPKHDKPFKRSILTRDKTFIKVYHISFVSKTLCACVCLEKGLFEQISANYAEIKGNLVKRLDMDPEQSFLRLKVDS